MDTAAQSLTDALFVGFDEALREQGTGDIGMGRRMKAFANAFFGRLAAYSGARDDAMMAEALAQECLARRGGGCARPGPGRLCGRRAARRWRRAISPAAN